jgi:hypothetical protein
MHQPWAELPSFYYLLLNRIGSNHVHSLFLFLRVKICPRSFYTHQSERFPIFAQTFGERNFRQMVSTRRDLCSLGEQLFRESTTQHAAHAPACLGASQAARLIKPGARMSWKRARSEKFFRIPGYRNRVKEIIRMISLTPFFQLPSVVVSTLHTVSDELRPLNDHQTVTWFPSVSASTNHKHACLMVSVKEPCRPILHGQNRLIA